MQHARNTHATDNQMSFRKTNKRKLEASAHPSAQAKNPKPAKRAKGKTIAVKLDRVHPKYGSLEYSSTVKLVTVSEPEKMYRKDTMKARIAFGDATKIFIASAHDERAHEFYATLEQGAVYNVVIPTKAVTKKQKTHELVLNADLLTFSKNDNKRQVTAFNKKELPWSTFAKADEIESLPEKTRFALYGVITRIKPHGRGPGTDIWISDDTGL